MCQDKAALGADWFEQQRSQLKVVLSDLELDLNYLREKMPSRCRCYKNLYSSSFVAAAK
jgi:hypothetical protein